MDADRSCDVTGAVALVTGASRGVGRGVAAELARRGARVYAASRTVAAADLPESVVRIPCDLTDDAESDALMARIRDETARLDILVNSAWGGYERMVEDGEFTWPRPFWEQPMWRWTAMMEAGVRAAFVMSRLAAPMLMRSGAGLIANISYWAARKYQGNVLYGVAKAATDKLTSDTAHELREHGVTVVSLYPGLVRTEAVLASGAFDLSNSESPEFVGRAVAALYNDPERAQQTGKVVVAAELARKYGFTDIDGRTPAPLSLDDA